MFRKMICLASFVLLLSLVGGVQAATLTWTDAGPDHLWSTPTNWNTGTVPTSGDEAKIGMLPGPTIANEGAVAQRAYVGHSYTTGALTVDGGTLTTTTWILVAQSAGIEGTINMISGTITTGDTLNVGQRGSGTLNMAGGTITIGTMFRIGHEPTATGHVNLDGGIITTKNFLMRTQAGSVGTMDVTAGTLIINGDKLSLVQGYIDDPNGWITAYGGNGTLQLDYDVTNEGKTTLKATGLVETASNPSPANEATDVARDVVLSWTPGEFADKHDVYFGTNFDNVNDVNRANPLGVLVSQNQDANSYTSPQRLDFGQTYYWQIDEVNAPPDSTIFQGDVWSFTVEPVAYPIDGNNITATASSSDSSSVGPENTINGSGLDADDLHSVENHNMWLSSMTGAQPTWIQYEFDRIHKLHQMWVWNHNTAFEFMLGFGLKDVSIEYSTDGADWKTLAGVPEFAQAPGADGYAHNTTVDFGGTTAKYVRLMVNSNWGGLYSQYGLSEVRFLYIRVLAREPDPDSGATNLDVDDVTLSWRAGREAATHEVYLGTDEQAVIDGTADVTTVTEASHGPLSLDLAQTYYWRVDEVNEAETPATWQGDIWNFATQEYLVVEDFEGYDDYEPNRVFDTWTDGWGVPTNGATMGYPNPIFVLDEHFVETMIVHGGRQSAPLFYDNNLKYSEAELPLSPPQDWTRNGVKRLSLWFYGDPANAVEQMYVKLNGSKVEYDGNPGDVKQASWKQWDIDLALFGVDLRNVTKLAIGFGDEMNLAPGGSGVVYLEDIRLYPLPEPKANLIGD